MDVLTKLRVVLVHDWLTGMRGGEKCLEALCRRFPRARLFSVLHRPGSVSPAIERLEPCSSPLRFLPAAHRYYRYLLPLMPLAARWRLPPCDLVVSCSHCVAKSAQPPRDVPHVCYCFTPMRYAWNMRGAYLGEVRGWRGALARFVLDRLQAWDCRTAQRVTHFVAISKTVQRRIRDCYGRDSRVIYPPVDTDFFHPAPVAREDMYLVVSAFAPYKRIDLAIAACNKLGRTLVVIGAGQEERRLRALAGPTVHFLGWQADAVVRDYLRRCRALLFPGEEEFGLVPVEAMACGAPVIAYAKGGATETVLPTPESADRPSAAEPTGVWFHEQSAEGLASALQVFESQAREFNPHAARRQALTFALPRFEQAFFGYLAEVMEKKRPPSPEASLRASGVR